MKLTPHQIIDNISSLELVEKIIADRKSFGPQFNWLALDRDKYYTLIKDGRHDPIVNKLIVSNPDILPIKLWPTLYQSCYQCLDFRAKNYVHTYNSIPWEWQD